MSRNPPAGALAEQLHEVAQQEGSASSLAFAYHELLISRFQRGLLVETDEHYTRWNTVCEAPGYLEFRSAAEVARGYASLNAWMLGSANSARKPAAQMIAWAQARNDPYVLIFAQYFESWLHYLLRDAPRAMAVADQALALSEELGFPLLTAFSQGIVGWAQAQLGNPDAGISLIRRTLSGFAESRS